MAVQAQYGVNLPENHNNRARPPQFHQVVGNDVDHRTSSFLNASSFLGKSPVFQIPPTVTMAGSNHFRLVNQLAGGRHGYTQQLDTAALLNGGEKDRLMAGSNSGRKRTREQAEDLQICSPWQQQQQLQQQQQPQQLAMNIQAQQPEAHQTTGPGSVVNPQSNGVSTGLQLRLTLEDDRLRSASPAFTSGRVEPAGGAKSSFVSAIAENFGSHLRQEQDEIAQLLKIQNEQLKSFLDEKRQRHAHQLVSAVEETVARELREKDMELEKAKLHNQEILERCAQLITDSHHWQTKVRNTETMVNILRANLQQAQQQQHSLFPLSHRMEQFPCKEGCGDSEGADDCASSYVDDINDAHTRAFNENRELREQRTCRVCRTQDVSMLLLPCRHLCLCQDCEGQLHACPLCRTPKNASVQVYMS